MCRTIRKIPDVFTFIKEEKLFRRVRSKVFDITCGHADRYGGILICGIQNLSTSEYIDGPGNIVQKILAVFRKTKVRDFADPVPFSIYEGRISVRPLDFEVESEILWTPRVGLSLKKQMQDRIHYIVKEYRALALPIQTKKGLKWINASLLLSNRLPLECSRVGSVKRINELLEQGKLQSSYQELALTNLATENDLLGVYGFFAAHAPN